MFLPGLKGHAWHAMPRSCPVVLSTPIDPFSLEVYIILRERRCEWHAPHPPAGYSSTHVNPCSPWRGGGHGAPRHTQRRRLQMSRNSSSSSACSLSASCRSCAQRVSSECRPQRLVVVLDGREQLALQRTARSAWRCAGGHRGQRPRHAEHQGRPAQVQGWQASWCWCDTARAAAALACAPHQGRAWEWYVRARAASVDAPVGRKAQGLLEGGRSFVPAPLPPVHVAQVGQAGLPV